VNSLTNICGSTVSANVICDRDSPINNVEHEKLIETQSGSHESLSNDDLCEDQIQFSSIGTSPLHVSSSAISTMNDRTVLAGSQQLHLAISRRPNDPFSVRENHKLQNSCST